MKIYSKDLAKNLNQLDRLKRVLLFGPDESTILYAESLLIQSIKKQGEWTVTKLDFKDIRNNPSVIRETLAETSLFGDRKILVINSIPANANKEFVDVSLSTKGDNILLLIAGDLKPGANLRKSLENDSGSLTVACYKDDPRDLLGFLRETLKEKNIKFEAGLDQVLLDKLPSSRFLIQSEVERLSLFLGEDLLTLEILEEIMADSGEANVDLLFQTIIKAKGDEIAKFLDRSFGEGVNFMIILRSLIRNFAKLEGILTLAKDESISTAAAIEKISPPIFFKFKPVFIEASKRISLTSCQKIIKQLCLLELDCKTLNLSQELLLSQKIFQLVAALQK